MIQTADTVRLCFESYIIAKIKCDENLCTIDFEQKDDRINRFWFRVAADKEEKCYGCGEQMSYFNLRGRNFPIWTSEPGVGRDKTTYVTWRSDVENKAGGDYYNTNYPQPTFVPQINIICMWIQQHMLILISEMTAFMSCRYGRYLSRSA